MATKRPKASKTNASGLTRQQKITATFKYVLPPELIPQYTDNLTVTHTDSEFIISFLQTEHPLLAPDADPKEIKTVNAKCVARLYVAPTRMPIFINALSENLKRFITTNAAALEELKKRK